MPEREGPPCESALGCCIANFGELDQNGARDYGVTFKRVTVTVTTIAQKMTTRSKRDLFGGAITAQLPVSFLDASYAQPTK
jgi:hypothetical protein